MSDKETGHDRADASFRQHRGSVYRYLLRQTRDHHEAEELTQRVFVDAAAALANPDCRPESMLAWLYAIAQRRVVDELRRRSRVLDQTRELAARLPAHTTGEYSSDIADGVRRAIGRLPAEQRSVVVMKVLEGRKFSEIAETLDTTEAACKMRFSRGIRHVRTWLDEEGLKP